MRKVDLFLHVRGCNRCARDHAELPFLLLQRPMMDRDGVCWTHWATCPTTGEPILMFIVNNEEDDEG